MRPTNSPWPISDIFEDDRDDHPADSPKRGLTSTVAPHRVRPAVPVDTVVLDCHPLVRPREVQPPELAVSVDDFVLQFRYRQARHRSSPVAPRSPSAIPRGVSQRDQVPGPRRCRDGRPARSRRATYLLDCTSHCAARRPEWPSLVDACRPARDFDRRPSRAVARRPSTIDKRRTVAAMHHQPVADRN